VVLCCLGDLMLDLIVRIETPFARGDDTPATTRTGAGGQAANVAAWAASLGADTRLIAKWGRDTPGRLVAAEVRARGVEVLGPNAPGRNGVVVSVVEPDGERSMLSDPGVAVELTADELRPEWFTGCDAIYVSGYALLRSPIDEAARAAAAAVKADGGRVAVDLSTWTAIRSYGAGRFLGDLEQVQPDVVFTNEPELEELGAEPPASTVVLKLGAGGAAVIEDGRREEHAARETEVVDSTGAGDALAAGYLVGGIELGLEAAARCIAKLGAMP
jgi:sugar/nucleoside kinase (ribokinase family)